MWPLLRVPLWQVGRDARTMATPPISRKRPVRERSSVIVVTNRIGNFLPISTRTGSAAGLTARVQTITRFRSVAWTRSGTRSRPVPRTWTLASARSVTRPRSVAGTRTDTTTRSVALAGALIGARPCGGTLFRQVQEVLEIALRRPLTRTAAGPLTWRAPGTLHRSSARAIPGACPGRLHLAGPGVLAG